MSDPQEPLLGVDLDWPNPARMYDYALGGAHNFAADREAFNRLLTIDPDAALVGRSNRAFLRRAVRYFVEQGIRQFLDLGSGIPTQGHAHEVARAVDPAARVVYVDNEPVAVAHSRRLLSDIDGVEIVGADIRDPASVLDSAEVGRLDLSEPVGLLAVAVLHYVSAEDDPAELLARYLAPLAPGSLLAVSHTTIDALPPAQAAEMRRLLNSTSSPVTHRTRAELAALLSQVDLVEPGLVWTPQWRPDGPDELLAAEPERSGTYAAVGRIRT
ncbi:SAM-dependent methyltransferase [Actinoalloteichus hymeniacidonis]|uniref:S-adenosyl methyltransferase n=1 Tax=Actinoalloteichus hymeniacidonis TaxID=340345 RepID=A0AAC9MZX5_9PSEU|nr:SAM-dependent methyltransferase [Actinoalloteichus hymeniacidonis]AOS64815.1 S-adenosyl methyltransferase [Actinoalloteichus hymeniacidonis]MBB5907111.1 hypothetical protein [Actinoalloteichus hymeniacidonis]